MFPDTNGRIEANFGWGSACLICGESRIRMISPRSFLRYLIPDFSSKDHEMSLIGSGFVTPVAQACTDAFNVIGQSEYIAPREYLYISFLGALG